MRFDETIEWLLDASNPSARWLALTLVLRLAQTAPEVQAAQEAIPGSPWARLILEGQHADGWWENEKNLGQPKLTGTMFRIEALADIGMPLTEQTRRTCELILDSAECPGEGFATARYRRRTPHECSNARLLFVFNHFGFGHDARVRAAADWLLANQMLDGGWNCNHEPKRRRDARGEFAATHRCSLDLPHHRSSLFTTMAVLKGLSSMAQPPQDAISRGVEFLLQHRVHWTRSSRRAIYRSPPRLYFPPQLHYDGLQPLRTLVMAGAGPDARLGDALRYLASRERDGRWPTDGPPAPPSRKRERTLLIEPAGAQSKWITANALNVLGRYETR
jgi:hypothetical protein